MSAKAIREATAKFILTKHLPKDSAVPCLYASVNEKTDWTKLENENKWLKSQKLVVKPDQLIKRRGKLGLLGIDKDYTGAQEWIKSRIGKDTTIEKTTGKIRSFIIEPFVKHKPEDEYYLCILSNKYADTILFHHEGGIEVGDVMKKSIKHEVPIGTSIDSPTIQKALLSNKAIKNQEKLAKFIADLHKLYVDLYFTYLEINPLVVTTENLHIVDVAAKLDATAEYLCKNKWGPVEYPPPFGRDAYPEEKFVADMDAKTGASLKLTVLNRKGRIWTMVAGGGASVIYTDTICDLGGVKELGNYGEYSGAPSEIQTYQYAKTILSLMTKEVHPDGKVLLIGGGIANFTNVAATFKGIITALKEFQPKLIEHKVKIFIRRGGPNYQEGLRLMREVGKSLGVPLYVFGPEAHMTIICGMALGKTKIPTETGVAPAMSLIQGGAIAKHSDLDHKRSKSAPVKTAPKKSSGKTDGKISRADGQLFTKETKAIVWGMQLRAIQSMLDFDYVCGRKKHSVVAIVYPFGGGSNQKFFWGKNEMMIPIFAKITDALKANPKVDVMVNFASLRSSYDSTIETMKHPQVKTVAIIAEGIPENMTRRLIKTANQKKVTIIGPATVGGLRAGCFKIGNTAGLMDNILDAKLQRPGSVCYVSRSGGLSNELNNIIGQTTNGVVEGIAIGGDRYPGSGFMDHIIRYEKDPACKMIVLLGEVGGVEEYEVCKALKEKKITKPLVAWCIGTSANQFTTDVQFGHAGAYAESHMETAAAKNEALKKAGAHVPATFDTLNVEINKVYKKLVESKVVIEVPEVPPPIVPMDYAWAKTLGLVRKPTSFITTVSDERGSELTYSGVLISDLMKSDLGIGGTVSLLWFKRCLPKHLDKFLEMCLMITADHGPAVSGAHNTIVSARAGKDLVSSLVSGLLTIGDRFGGAMEAAAKTFTEAVESGETPAQFVVRMRKSGKLIMGIGHRVKSINNPDARVKIITEYVLKNFEERPIYEYALAVEKITTTKKPNLILNVDGAIGIAIADMLRSSGYFTEKEAKEYMSLGLINGLFVLGRTAGFIGHYVDQKRLKQGLYRHPWDDVSYRVKRHDCSE